MQLGASDFSQLLLRGDAEAGQELEGRCSHRVREHDELDQGSGSGDGEKGLAYGNIMKIKPIRCCTSGLRNGHNLY